LKRLSIRCSYEAVRISQRLIEAERPDLVVDASGPFSRSEWHR
jgi:hypothetical protein